MTTLQSVWCKSTIAIFLLGFVLAEGVWLKLYGFEKAKEQSIENLIPALSGAVVAVVATGVIQFVKVSQLINREGNELRLMTANQADEAKMVSFWLNWHLASANMGVSKAYLFGSVTHNFYGTSDVDAVLLFKQMSAKEYVKKQSKLKSVAQGFTKTFGKPLHFQRFLAEESGEFERFVSMQSEPICFLRSE